MTTDTTHITKEGLLPCPFCKQGAELFTERWINPNGSEWGFADTTYAHCLNRNCRAIGPRVERKYLAQFTEHTVEDFRRDPALRSRIEKEHAAYLLTVDQRAIKLWNTRAAELSAQETPKQCAYGEFDGFKEICTKVATVNRRGYHLCKPCADLQLAAEIKADMEAEAFYDRQRLSAQESKPVRERIIHEIMCLIHPEPKEIVPKPTIDDLEKMLESDNPQPIDIRPDGTIWTRPSTTTTVGAVADAILRAVQAPSVSAQDAQGAKPKSDQIMEAWMAVTDRILSYTPDLFNSHRTGLECVLSWINERAHDASPKDGWQPVSTDLLHRVRNNLIRYGTNKATMALVAELNVVIAAAPEPPK